MADFHRVLEAVFYAAASDSYSLRSNTNFAAYLMLKVRLLRFLASFILSFLRVRVPLVWLGMVVGFDVLLQD